VLDDFSRYIVAWRLGPTMCASDLTATLDQALAASGLDHIAVAHRPRLLSDNGSSYVAEDLAKWLEAKGMQHVRGAPYHPQTQGKIERWHQTLKNRILLDNYCLPGDLERRVRGPSWNTTITSAIMRASTTSHQPMSTSAEPRRSSQNANTSSVRPLRTAACKHQLQAA
jgi:transposase InsO family protein